MSPDPVGTLEIALAHAAHLLETRPALAVEQAEEILRHLPAQPQAMLLRAQARRRLGALDEARALLESLREARPQYAAVHAELAFTLRDLGRSGEAIEPIECAVRLDPSLGPAWLALGDLYREIGNEAGADRAFAQYVKCATRDPLMQSAAAALCENRLAAAEPLLRARIRSVPNDVVALRMLAEVAGRLRRYGDAEVLLRRCVELAPCFVPARQNLALVLHRQNRPVDALTEIEQCLRLEPCHAGLRNLKAAILGVLGQYDASLRLYREVLEQYPRQAKVWMSYGHALKTSGHEKDSIAAYRKSIELMPQLGESYWSLANLKTYRFPPAEIQAMRGELGQPDLDPHERFHFHFALGKALEDANRFEESFTHYAEGNRLRRLQIQYDPDTLHGRVDRARALFTAEFLRARAGLGCPAPDPIFIVGLPRSGSTLIEQILASHSAVEGTMELHDMMALARRVMADAEGDEAGYQQALADLERGAWWTLGEEYIQRTRVHRKRGAPFFIDKMPNNFLHLGLILLALPNARIVDARRHPLACCFSGFKQHFAMGQHFSYRLEDIGGHYRDYVDLMAHFDRVAPGRVHRVLYENMVEDTEAQVRSLLEYCGLPFEPECLRFFDNARAVRTASSEQVRRPIFREGLDQWRHFEPWLGPLKEALGPVLDAYPAAPR